MLEGEGWTGGGNRSKRECECENIEPVVGKGGEGKERDKEEDCDGTKLVRGHLAKFSIL